MGESGALGVLGVHRALLEAVRIASLNIGSSSEILCSEPLCCVSDVDAQAPPRPPRPVSSGSSSRLVPGGPCMWCGVNSTPQ
ncbi:hypothetical protein TSOC_000605, partial [Tetrabaena socialis]